jgi:hypothetical protein
LNVSELIEERKTTKQKAPDDRGYLLTHSPDIQMLQRWSLTTAFGCSYHWIAKTMATTRMTPVVSIKISAAS